MGSIQNTVHYCSVSKGNRTLYAYSRGDHEIENLIVLCLEMTPAFHKWYFETIGKRIYGFLIEDGYVYFMIADEGLRNLGGLQFLENLRDEFKKAAKKGSRGSFSGMNAVGVQEQLVPVIRRLITSLESVSQSGDDWKAETALSDHAGLSPSPNNTNGQIEVVSSTKAPLLGKSSKQEKKKAKDHVIAVRDAKLEELCKSTDRVKVGSTLDSNNPNGAGSSISLQKDLGSMRIRSNSQSIRKKWWRQVCMILVIDAVVCLILFVIWLSICRGIACVN